MPLPLTVSCFSKIQIGFTFLVPAHPGSPGKRAVKRVCVCVCYLNFFLLLLFFADGVFTRCIISTGWLTVALHELNMFDKLVGQQENVCSHDATSCPSGWTNGRTSSCIA